jgi:hypothetical protein
VSEQCRICGAADPVDAHHLTGKAEGVGYLDPGLVARLCHDDHELCHDDLRIAGVDQPLPEERGSVVERVAYRLRRVGLFLARVVEVAALGWLAGLASGVVAWAEDLESHVRYLDGVLPAWRTLGGSAT